MIFEEAKKLFSDPHFRMAINRLKQPLALARSPLTNLTLVTLELHKQGRPDTPQDRAIALEQIIDEAIDSLLPPNAGQSEEAGIAYYSLHYRYREGLKRSEAAKRLRLEHALRTYDRVHQNAFERLRSNLYDAEKAACDMMGGATSILIPNNLPRREEFIQREDYVDRILEVLPSIHRQWLVLIDGSGGMGKTSIALEAAYVAAERGWFQGVIWADARPQKLTFTDIVDLTPSILTLSDVFDKIGEALDRRIMKSAGKEKETKVYDILKRGRYLLVIDNFETIENKQEFVRFLTDKTKFPDSCKVIVTGRHHDLDDGRHVRVGGMQASEAIAFMRSVATELNAGEVIEASSERLKDMWSVTGGCALAMRWLVGQIGERGYSMGDCIDNLANISEQSALLEFCFRRSYQLLSDSGKLVLHALAMFAKSASRQALAHVSGLTAEITNDEITKLLGLALVDDGESHYFSLLHLTRLFVLREISLAGTEQKTKLVRRSVEYYIDFCQRSQANIGSMRAERENILAVLDWSYQRQEWDAVLAITRTISSFLFEAGYWQDYEKVSDMGLEASRACKAFQAEVEFLITNRGYMLYSQQRYDESRVAAETGLGLARKYNYMKGVGLAERLLGLIFRDTGDLESAKEILTDGYALTRDIGEHDLARQIEGSLSVVLRRLKDYAGAALILEADLNSAESCGNRRDVAIAKCRLATLAYDQVDFSRARRLYLEAIKIEEDLGRIVSLAFNYRKLALLERDSGNTTEAVAYATKALAIFGQVGSSADIAQVDKLLSELNTSAKLRGVGGG